MPKFVTVNPITIGEGEYNPCYEVASASSLKWIRGAKWEARLFYPYTRETDGTPESVLAHPKTIKRENYPKGKELKALFLSILADCETRR